MEDGLPEYKKAKITQYPRQHYPWEAARKRLIKEINQIQRVWSTWKKFLSDVQGETKTVKRKVVVSAYYLKP